MSKHEPVMPAILQIIVFRIFLIRHNCAKADSITVLSNFAGQPGQVGTPISGAPAGTPGSGGTAPRRMNANKSGTKDLVGPKTGNF